MVVVGGFVLDDHLLKNLKSFLNGKDKAVHQPYQDNIENVRPLNPEGYKTLRTETKNGNALKVIAEFKAVCAADELQRKLGGESDPRTLVTILGSV